MKLFDVDGNEVEATPQAEVEASITKAKEEAVTGFKDSEEYKKSAQELQEAKDALAKASDKDANFKALREAKEAAEKKAADLEDKFGKEISGVKDLILKKEFDSAINIMSDGDEELAKKIRVIYDRNVKPEDTEEVRKEKLAGAYKEVTATNPVPGIFSPSGKGAGNRENNGGGNTDLSPELKSLGAKLGITDKDIEKYGTKPK